MEILIIGLLWLAYKIVEFIINCISLACTSASESAKRRQHESDLALQKQVNELLSQYTPPKVASSLTFIGSQELSVCNSVQNKDIIRTVE